VSTFSTTALVQYQTLVAASANTIQPVVPGTLGWVLSSAGPSGYPSYQALPYTPMPLVDKAISFAAMVQTAYAVTANSTATLPASPSQGDTIAFVVDNATAILTVTANTGQLLQIGKAISAAAGTAVSNFNGDSVTFKYRAADTKWIAFDVIGTWTVT
jgi:archaellum component FlaG (FlaF/FlaG flagellin family)